MGTPHCNSGLAEWAVVGSKFLQDFRCVNQGTLEVLQQKSQVMARIRQDFHTMLRGWGKSRDGEMAIKCFYEELPVPLFWYRSDFGFFRLLAVTKWITLNTPLPPDRLIITLSHHGWILPRTFRGSSLYEVLPYQRKVAIHPHALSIRQRSMQAREF